MPRLFKRLSIKNRILKNAAWIIGCKIVQALLGVAVTMISARLLGPSNYGIINYAISVFAFILPVMQLGFDQILVREFVDRPDKEGSIIGTALCLNLLSAFVCYICALGFVLIANYDDTVTFIVCALYGINIFFQAVMMIQYWFQSKLFSKYTSLIMLGAYVVVSAYKIILLVSGKSIYWFAISETIEYALVSIAMLITLKKLSGIKLSFSRDLAVKMLKKGRYYIVSAMMVTIFAQTDKIMLMLMVGDKAVGFYSAASTCASMTAFVFVAIIDSARPSILESKHNSNDIFENNMSMLYSVIIYFALVQSLLIAVFAKPIVWVLYGSDYGESVNILRLIVWYTTFSYMGAVRNIWILAEDKYSVLWKINLSGSLCNIVLNFILIPFMGTMGAALASLITQIFTNVIIGFIMKSIRPNNRLMLRGLNPKMLINKLKKSI